MRRASDGGDAFDFIRGRVDQPGKFDPTETQPAFWSRAQNQDRHEKLSSVGTQRSPVRIAEPNNADNLFSAGSITETVFEV